LEKDEEEEEEEEEEEDVPANKGNDRVEPICFVLFLRTIKNHHHFQNNKKSSIIINESGVKY
jgi:hypothetical protein